MKILFIVPYPTEGPSNRFRVEQYLPELKRKGISYSLRPFCNSVFYRILLERGHFIKKMFYLLGFSFSRLLDVARSAGYDIVFIHREASPTKDFMFEWLLRQFGKKVIYDFDDSIFLKKPKKVEKAISISDAVITGNQFLKDYAVRFNKEVMVIPTSIDTDKYTPDTSPKDDGKVIVGWMGSPTTVTYLSRLKNVFRTLSAKYKNVEFRVVGAKFKSDGAFPLVNKPWSLESEVWDLQALDIGVMPIPDSDWTRGKCAFKIIQYMSVGVPAVASPWGMNSEVIKDGENGMLASNEEEWCEKLSRLIESPELRKRLGENGRKTVLERYSLKVNAPKLLGVFEKSGKDI